MTSKVALFAISLYTIVIVQNNVAAHESPISPITNATNSPSIPLQNLQKRPSIWSRTVHHLRQSRRQPTPYKRMYLRRSTEMKPIVDQPLQDVPISPSANDEESQFLQSDTFLNLKDFANQLVNETATILRSSPQPRSYQTTDVGAEDTSQHQQQQLWEDKDQAYHASSYTGLDYEPPTSYHHPFPHPPPLHYYPVPQKKDDTLFTKVALIALFKLILAKLKAIGFLKIILLFALKVPLFFFKMLIIFKGFKFLKLLSIPFLIAAFILPFLPLLPFLLFAFLPILFIVPLALPLLLPLLMFLPLIPVTTPATAAAARRRREISVPESITANQTWSILDEQWKGDRKKKMFRTRARPASTPRRSGTSRYEPFLNEEHTENLIELTQRVIQSQQCMERAACEIATYNDSKIYQTAVIWALGKLQTYAPAGVQNRIEQYSKAYEKGMQRRSNDFCSDRFKCNRPKVFLVQGHHSYNVI